MNARLAEALADLTHYLQRSSGLSPEVSAALAAEAGALSQPSRCNAAEYTLEPAFFAAQASQGLALLAAGAPLPPDSASEIAGLLRLVTAAPRFAAMTALTRNIMLQSRRFNQWLWLECQPLADKLSGVPEHVNFLVVLAALSDQEKAIVSRRIPDAQADAARARVHRALADALGRGGRLAYTDLPDLAYDLRAASADLGSLSFSLQAFHGPIQAYRHANSGEVIMLPPSGMHYDSRGYVFGSSSRPGVTPPLTAEVTSAEGELRSNVAITQEGLAQSMSLSLQQPSWRQVLAPGDDAIEIHVPEGADLSIRAVELAMRLALGYYAEHFPDFAPRGFFCHSWLLDCQLQRLLPPGSRILAFQRLFRLYPCPYSSEFVLQMVFGPDFTPGNPLPRRTSLQRSLATLMEAGGQLLEGGGLRLIESGHVEPIPARH